MWKKYDKTSSWHRKEFIFITSNALTLWVQYCASLLRQVRYRNTTRHNASMIKSNLQAVYIRISPQTIIWSTADWLPVTEWYYNERGLGSLCILIDVSINKARWLNVIKKLIIKWERILTKWNFLFCLHTTWSSDLQYCHISVILKQLPAISLKHHTSGMMPIVH